MLRRTMLFALTAPAFLLLTGLASAQIIVPQLPRVQPPNVDGFKQLERALEQNLQQRRPDGKANDGSIRWGGVRLTRADANLQQQLGLPEKEGLVITAVDPNSPADKAGLKAEDVLVKINNKSVPNDLDGFSKLLKDQKVDEAADLVVVRKGKEETIKAAKMPALAQGPGGGGRGVRPLGAMGLIGPIIKINQGFKIGRLPVNPVLPGKIDKLHVEMTVNGAKIVRKQDGDQFSGEYSKDDLKITVSGKLENGRAVPGEITVTEGKETKKYPSLKEVPVQHQPLVQQLLPTQANNLMLSPALPNFPELRLPLLP